MSKLAKFDLYYCIWKERVNKQKKIVQYFDLRSLCGISCVMFQTNILKLIIAYFLGSETNQPAVETQPLLDHVPKAKGIKLFLFLEFITFFWDLKTIYCNFRNIKLGVLQSAFPFKQLNVTDKAYSKSWISFSCTTF